MKKEDRIIFIFLVLILILGCGKSNSITKVTINEVLEHPRKYESKVIQVEGEVTGIFSLFFVKYFSIKDDTGEIIVMTERILPKKGERIKVKGKVIEAFSIADKTLTAIKETQEGN
jgi:hypothetical protein